MNTNVNSQTESINAVTFVTTEEFLEHWQGHRRLTRKMIEMYPDDKLFTYSIGGMRPFAELVMEMVDMAEHGIVGIVSDEWPTMQRSVYPTSKEGILELWDKVTSDLDAQWPNIPPQRFHEVTLAFGQYEGTVFSTIFYFIDNEIHHRGQGYVYLRSLGIEPPYFWER